MTSDSLLHILDSLKQSNLFYNLVDSSKTIIPIIRDTVIVESKSETLDFISKIGTLITAVLAIIISGILSWITVKRNSDNINKQIDSNNKNIEEQIKNANINLLKQIDAERQRMRDDNVIKLRKEWIKDFQTFTLKVYRTLIEICQTLDEMDEKKAEEYSTQILEFRNMSLINFTIDSEELNTVDETLDAFDNKFLEWIEIYFKKKLNEKEMKAFTDELTGLAGGVHGAMSYIIYTQIKKLTQ